VLKKTWSRSAPGADCGRRLAWRRQRDGFRAAICSAFQRIRI